MHSIVQDVLGELADNWLAFLYIVMTCVFSIYFLRERRLETRLLKEASDRLQKQINARFDRFEAMLIPIKPRFGSVDPQFQPLDARATVFRSSNQPQPSEIGASHPLR
jgi:hypothetical protein